MVTHTSHCISDSLATGVSLVNIRLLPFSTSDFCNTVYYKLNASITNVGFSFWCRNPMLRFGVLPSVDVACEECCRCMQRCWFPQTLPYSPAAMGSLVGVAPQTKLQAPRNWNMKHFKSVEFLSNFRMSSPLTQTWAPYWRLSGDSSVPIPSKVR